ncbi:MAG: hypothetical protein K0S01_3025 [Herbinix sp.]|jgi:uncharacterized membrane protein|nr:hypothetical protein [Herbinix sp.]
MSINNQRLELIKTILNDDKSAAEEEETLHQLLKEYVSKDAISEHDNSVSFGQKAADNLAKFAGSWTFIIAFFCILALWIILNAVILSKPYDIYPFILLNLILSCLASIQAPVIMMSQNRQEQKDRLRSVNDYKVNLKSEIIIEDLHLKLDNIIENQQVIMDRISALEKSNK